MGLGSSLAVVFAAFVAILTAVMAMAFRERRIGRAAAGDTVAEAASDARVMAILFAAIPGGMLLTVIAGWLVFL